VTLRPAGERVFVGLGANLGDAIATVRTAIDALDRLPGTRVVARSDLWRSAPVEASGPAFVNAVVELRTKMLPEALLVALRSIEARFGRERPYPNAPRTLDLDLLFYGERRVDSPALTLPHPRAHARAFVQAPLAQIAPELALPLPPGQFVERITP
jgi:2-amino-4-hydroxy-6-hydroxymethyldihydropteridine diphosphokinase